MSDVLFVNHGQTQKCGVHAFGKKIYEIISNSDKYDFEYLEADSIKELINKNKESSPKAIIYNYHPMVMPWAVKAKTRLPNTIHLGIGHEFVQHNLESNDLFKGNFDYIIIADPSLTVPDKWFQTGRPLNKIVQPEISYNIKRPVIGSFGFFFTNKNYDKILHAVKQEFTSALVRFHITVAHFNGGFTEARLAEYIKRLHSIIADTDIELEVTTDYRSDDDMVNFLASNNINLLFYDENRGRGISSALDYCISAGKPILVTDSDQFLNVKGILPEYPGVSITQALEAGNDEVLKLQKLWGPESLIRSYETIMESLNV